MRDPSANRKAGQLLTPQPISASGAALSSLSRVDLSPAGSVVVYLDSENSGACRRRTARKTVVDTDQPRHRVSVQ